MLQPKLRRRRRLYRRGVTSFVREKGFSNPLSSHTTICPPILPLLRCFPHGLPRIVQLPSWAVNRYILKSSLLQYFGRISFNLYLVHVPLLCIVSARIFTWVWSLHPQRQSASTLRGVWYCLRTLCRSGGLGSRCILEGRGCEKCTFRSFARAVCYHIRS